MSNIYTTEPQENQTRGSLVPAELFACDAKGNKTGKAVRCSFNPYEYTVSQTNSYDYKPKAKAGTKVELKNAGPQTLKLNLIFDVYEKPNGASRDVSLVTRELWKMMTPDPENKTPKEKKPDAPYVTFQWGIFKFLAVITNMSHKFILFDYNGIPLRAKVDVTLTQHASYEDDYKGSYEDRGAPTIPALPDERLDNVAAQETGNPADWRAIAQANNITNPLARLPKRPLTRPQGL
ncbi:MAG: hypothetical protein KC434_01545 [Anaerolineales bacterium]|nr:hypothetical protein [Anaerolineales bacterium]